jgi:hypothetical protein
VALGTHDQVQPGVVLVMSSVLAQVLWGCTASANGTVSSAHIHIPDVCE